MRMLFVAGIGLAVFIEFLLISKKDKSLPDQILTWWMFLVLVNLFLMYLFFTGDIYDFPFLLGVEHPLPLLHGVFLYFYVATLTEQLPEKKWMVIFHFLPAILIYAYLVPFLSLSGDEKIHVYRIHGAGHEGFMILKWYAIVLSGIVYVIWSALLLKKHRNNMRDQFSDLERVNLQWLRILTYGMGGIWLLVILFKSDLLVSAGIVVFVFMIGFFGVRQAGIFISTKPETDSPDQKLKYEKSGLTEETSGDLHQSLLRLMKDDAMYKRSDLSINDLASKLGVHPNYLSQVINQKEGMNFYDFVNAYRIEEFKRIVAIPKNRNFTILSLAYDCGFSSKSSFNRYFKKATGKTPSEYFSTLSRDQATPL